MESVGLKEEDALVRTKWNIDIQNHSGDGIMGEARGKEEVMRTDPVSGEL